MRRTHNVTAITGKYTKGGEEKSSYTNVGVAMTDDKGRISIKLHSIPVGPEWNGWLSLYPIEAKNTAGEYREGEDDRPPI